MSGINYVTHLGKGDPVPVLEPVPGLVQTGDDALRILRNAGDHRRDGLRPIRIINSERLAKVTKDLREESSSLGDDQSDSMAMGEGGDALLFGRQRVGQHDHTELLQEFLGQWFLVDTGRDVVVQLGELDARHFGPIAANVVLRQIELGGQVGQSAVDRVVQRDRLDAAQDDVLGHLNAESSQAADQHVRGGHTTHRIVTQDVQLAGIQPLVDVSSRCSIRR